MSRLFKVEVRHGIPAPVDDVYAVLNDLEAWPQWSPIHREVTGKFAFGAPVRLVEHYDGLGTWELDGHLSDWSPLSHIHLEIPRPFYVGRLIRYFEMEPLSETGTAFSVGAGFAGFLSEREGRRYRPCLREGFKAFAEALEARVASLPSHGPSFVPASQKPVKRERTRPAWGKVKTWGR